VGTLIVPPGGLVYIDANPLIYTVEKHPTFGPLLHPLWHAANAKTIEVVSSDLLLMEALVGPIKAGDLLLQQTYEQALFGTELRLLPISQPVLREAARLRATTKLKSPDALHLATAQHHNCALFVTNDAGFRGIPGVAIVILSDLLAP
jgi:predicted nucleic acid-binding protein